MSVIFLTQRILPAVFEGDGVKYIDCEFDANHIVDDQFSSSVVFATVVVEKDRKCSRIPVVVKVEPNSSDARKILLTNVQFYNEVFMYSIVIPFMKKVSGIEDIFVEFYYGIGSINDSSQNLIITKDVRPLGYCLSKEKAYLDYEHLALGLSKLGKFHASSYSGKEKSGEQFYDIVSKLEKLLCSENYKIEELIKACVHRAVDPLVKEGKHVEILQRFLKRIDNSYFDLISGILPPEDPLSVICHGDFFRNNMLFKYTDGQPTDVKFLDFAVPQYTSPVVDISFFLFMNASKEVRSAHWDDLLEVYHRSLSTTVPGVKVPALEEIKEAMREKAVFGFMHASYFLPLMLFGHAADMSVLFTKSMAERTHYYTSRGGEEGTKVLSEIVEELVDRKCLTLEHSWL